MRTFILASLVLLSGCGVVGPQWEDRSQTDQGDLCLASNADEDGTVSVFANLCLSSSCSRDAVASCNAVLDGQVITVTAQFDWQEATGNIACTDDCGSLSATCEVGPLPAGTYTVKMGSGVETFDVPTTEECSPF
ncbi:MAG: hypothetical protein AB8H79_03750 [Myxococcota bacterium]